MTTKYTVEKDDRYGTWMVRDTTTLKIIGGACLFDWNAQELADLLNTLQAKADRLDAAEKKLKTLIDDFTPKITWDCGVLSGLRIASDVLKEPNHD